MEPLAVFEIHSDIREHTYIGEVTQVMNKKSGSSSPIQEQMTVHSVSLQTGSETGKKITYNHILHANNYKKFLNDLRTAFEDPNLKINAANELQQLRQGKDTLMEYFTKFELKAATARYHHLDNVLIDLLKGQVRYEI